MPGQELDLRANMLREQIAQIKSAPDDKSINQLKEEVITRHFEEVSEIARMLALQDEIYAIGQSPDQAIRALAYAKKWGEVTQIVDLEGGDPKYTWGCQFFAGGTSMKAAGWSVPGGVVMTWWK